MSFVEETTHTSPSTRMWHDLPLTQISWACLAALGLLTNSLCAQSTIVPGRLMYRQGERFRFPAIELLSNPCDPSSQRTRVTGSGYSAEAWYAIGDTADESTLISTGMVGTFDDSGRIHLDPRIVYLPGSYGGDFVTLQLRVWDNRGGLISAWQEALKDPQIARGSSPLIRNEIRLSGTDRDGNPALFDDNFWGRHQSFTIAAVCPEPSGPLLIGLSLGAVTLVFRRTHRRG